MQICQLASDELYVMICFHQTIQIHVFVIQSGCSDKVVVIIFS